MPCVLFAYAYIGGNNNSPITYFDITGIILYLYGSYLNTYSEFTRHVWKKRTENKGHLYTEGLFKYSMHINYLGDSVLFTGLALITHRMIMLAVPFFMTLNFVLFLIPSLDNYLHKKYGKEFEEYAERTKKFIPLIY